MQRPVHVARDKMDPHRRNYTSYSPEAGRRGALWTSQVLYRSEGWRLCLDRKLAWKLLY